uniref:Uncharacterized protein n=1 Tax=Molossus molossus TaxID=27622 RepID=A0A7J8F8Y6_MOLMO|nr:hypothetical protein HJG59_008532 [Molossus molossus]
MTCQFSDSIGLSIVFAQVGVNKVHNVWSNGSLEHSRQSDIFARRSPLFQSTRISVDEHTPWRGEEKATLLSTWGLPQQKPLPILNHHTMDVGPAHYIALPLDQSPCDFLISLKKFCSASFQVFLNNGYSII